MSEDLGLIQGIFVVLLLGTLAIFGLQATQHHRVTMAFQVKLFLYALGIRFLASIVIYQFGVSDLLKDEDAGMWTRGITLMQDWVGHGVTILDLPGVMAQSFSTNHQGYFYMIGALFYITDSPTRYVAAAPNCVLGALTVVMIYRVARTLFSEWVAVRAAWACVLFPSLIVWSAQTLKEPVVIFLETAALYGCIRLREGNLSPRYVLLCGLTTVFLLPFRFYATLIVGVAVLLSLALPGIARLRTGLAALCLSVVLIPGALIAGTLAKQEATMARFDVNQIEQFKHDIASGPGAGSGVVMDYDLSTPTGFAMATLVGGAYLLLAPFPWQLGGASTRMLLTLPELLVWWALFFTGVISGVWYCVRYRLSQVAAILFLILGLGLLYSITFGNVGLVFRQRAQLLPWLLIFAMVGLEQRMQRLAARRSATGPYAQYVPSQATR